MPVTLSAAGTALAQALGAATTSPSDSSTSDVTQTAEAVVSTTVDVLSLAWKIGLGALIGVVIAFLVVVVLRMMGRRRVLWTEVVRFARNALYVFAGLLGAHTGATLAVESISTPLWARYVLQAVLIAAILAATWVGVGLAKAIASSVVLGVKARGDAGRTNRVTTQTQILRRVVEVVIVICGLVGAVMTFPSARFAMGSLLASAGLVSVIAGLAAQSTLGNVFAGLQLATTDAIRVDDVVEVNGLHGQIEEITLTYVVVKVWDERRLILPSTYFTSNPFENWTRRSHQMVGAVTFEVDWRVPVAAMRAEVAAVVASTPLWDGRTAELLITATSATSVTARVTLSAKDSGDVWALQCLVRERIITWLQREAPYALPRTRIELDEVEVAHDPEPERVARLAEELVALQAGAGEEAAEAGLAPTAVQRPVDGDPIEAARVRAAAKGHARLRRTRRDRVRRRRILAREPEWRDDAGSATSVISTAEQEAFLREEDEEGRES